MQNLALVHQLNELLEADRFHDYAPNGLQVEGKKEITRLVTGVTASEALLREAIRHEADAVLVHHGWFWKHDPLVITGMRRQRIKLALDAGLNVIAYHLPLDAHPELGNNAQLAKVLDFEPEGTWGEMDLGWIGTLREGPVRAGRLAQTIEARLGRRPLLVGPEEAEIDRIAWCSGAAQGFFEEALEQGAQAFLSGEISEQTFHMAVETQRPYFACGHHATERYGIRALGRWVSEHCGIEVTHIDIDNPV